MFVVSQNSCILNKTHKKMGIKPLKDFTLIGGTSFHGKTITATLDELIRIFGPPSADSNGQGEKTNFEWDLVTDDGTVFTIYDWKEYRKLTSDEPVEWHIGAHTKEDSDKVFTTIVRHLMDMLTKY